MIPLGILGTLSGGAAAGAYELISTTVANGSVSSVSFSSLSPYASTYKHLQLRIVSRVANYTALDLQFNGDTNGNYTQHYLRGSGSSVGSSGTPNESRIRLGEQPTSGQATGNFGGFVADILDPFSTTRNKTVRSLGGATELPVVALYSGAWFSTAATSSLTVYAGSNFVAGSRFSLYGIKG